MELRRLMTAMCAVLVVAGCTGTPQLGEHWTGQALVAPTASHFYYGDSLTGPAYLQQASAERLHSALRDPDVDSEGYVDSRSIDLSFGLKKDLKSLFGLPHEEQSLVLRFDHYGYADQVYSDASLTTSSAFLLFKVVP